MSTVSYDVIKQQPLLQPTAPLGEEQKVDAILNMAKEHLGFIPDGLRLFSLSPTLLETFFTNIGYFRSGTNLSPVLTTMIRYLVSSKAECHFCIDLNEGFLDQMGVDLDTARASLADITKAPVADNERILLDIALRTINDPDSVNQNDIDEAHAQGWSDHDIFDASAQASNNRAFNYLLRTFKIEQQGVFA